MQDTIVSVTFVIVLSFISPISFMKSVELSNQSPIMKCVEKELELKERRFCSVGEKITSFLELEYSLQCSNVFFKSVSSTCIGMLYSRGVQHAAHLKSLCGPLSYRRVLLLLAKRNNFGLFYHLKIVSLDYIYIYKSNSAHLQFIFSSLKIIKCQINAKACLT